MYQIPEGLEGDIRKFATLAQGYEAKTVSATEFKAFRVPLGVYEQRKNDVYMARVRATGGAIRPAQFIDIVETAVRHKSNLLHLTTRAEVQIQNLELGEVEALLNELKTAELATKGGGGNTVRNIIVSEESGVGIEETFDTTPHAISLTNRVVPEADSYLMPRKLKIAFSSNEHDEDSAPVNDIGFVAKIKDGKRGFKVYVGGGAGSKPAIGWVWKEWVSETELYAIVDGVKKFFSAYGNRKNRNQARLRFVFYKNGAEETFRLLDEYVAEARKRVPQYSYEPIGEERPTYHYTPGGKVSAAERAAFETWQDNYVFAQRQKGYRSVIIGIRLGNIPLTDEKSVEALKEIVKFAGIFGEHTLRFTKTQNIRLRNIPEEALEELYLKIKRFADVAQPAALRNIVSCTGADTCRLGICLSKGLAAAIEKALQRSGLPLERLKTASIHVTGCPNFCAQPLWADLGFSGKVLRTDRPVPAYRIYIGASLKEHPRFAEGIGDVNAWDIPKWVVDVVRAFLATEAEDFGAYLRSDEGRKTAIGLVEKYQEIPAFEDDKNYYFDHGAETLFSITDRGKAECSAGLFDMIGVDEASIKENKKALETETDVAKRDELLWKIGFAAARMLLVTRGLDPRSDKEVFDAFKQSFIDEGYISKKYVGVLDKAAQGKGASFDAAEAEELLALGEDVIALYGTMDDSLQFKKTAAVAEAKPTAETQETAAQPTAAEGVKVDRYKNLSGVACPMNFVRTKLELASMKSGDVLEIRLDDGQPIENVPGSVKLEGHTILEQAQLDNGQWRVVIRKA